ncbi:hypothetical protein SLA2020_003640 [Shorea laevis]
MGKRPHILVAPYPAQVHVAPLMKLSVQIAAYSIKVTFVNTQFIHAQVQAALPEEQNHITLVSIPDGLEPEDDRKDEAKLGLQDQEQLALGFHTTKLIEDGILDTDGNSKSCESIQLSGDMPAWKHNELGWSFPGKPELRKFFFRRGCEDIGILKNSDWLLCNTFYELDPPGCNLIPNILSNVPLLPSTHVDPLAGSLNPEDSTCLDWLDKQVAGSVVYDAFGSTAKLSQLQLEELAVGLELTGNHFLWVVRSDLVNGMHSKFIHYRWNSTMEGLSMVVLFLCWPYFADQFHNKCYICETWKIGLGLEKAENGIITSHEINAKVNALLCSEDIKANVMHLKETAKKSNSPGGSSFNNFERFIKRLKQLDA